ncbi:MAG: transcriptional regulator [Alteromonadaceae bacterium]|nr:transcriptional regulator [Alteromonadaceae bacterium]
MSESKFETVSSLVDNYQQDDATFDELVKDSELSDTWDRYHLIGDVMRNDIPQAFQLDLASSIAAAIEQEPTVLAPANTSKSSQNEPNNYTKILKAKVIQFAKPFGQIAIAASAAGLMVLGVQQNVATNDTITPSQTVQTIPFGGMLDPVSYNVNQPNRTSQQQAYVEQQRRFQALLSDHQQQIKLKSVGTKSASLDPSTDNNQQVKDLPK